MAIVNPTPAPAIGSTEVDRAATATPPKREAAPDTGSFEDALEQQSDENDETVASTLKLSGGIRPHQPPAVPDGDEAPESAVAAPADGSDDPSLAAGSSDEAAVPDLSVFKTGIRPHQPPAETPEAAPAAEGAAAVETEAAGDPLPAAEAAAEGKNSVQAGADTGETEESPTANAEMALLLAQRAAKASRQSLESFLFDTETTRKAAPGNRFSGQA